ncbi:MAG: hypothetical protein HBSAPP03_04030 [Phycisphaerae bacterium]|nr:MAG: hypothetical protein HBSAPP03_04030 [Phycisphaerae bacterium]
MAVLGAVAASGDESAVGAMRLETSRAFFAAESGAVVTLRLTLAGEPLPAAGSTLPLTHAMVEYEVMPNVGQPGDIVIIGSSGTTRRRVKLTLDEP